MMKKVSLRKRQAAVTHKRIYDVALSLFAKKGYENVTVDAICSRSHVSKGAFYSHVKSKHAVAIEQFVKTDLDLNNILVKRIESIERTEDKLFIYIVSTFEYVNKGGSANKKVMFQIQLASDKSSKVVPEKSTLYTVLKSVITSAMEKGEVRHDKSVDEITLAFLRMYQGLVFEWCLANGSYDLVEEGKRMFAFMWDGIRQR